MYGCAVPRAVALRSLGFIRGDLLPTSERRFYRAVANVSQVKGNSRTVAPGATRLKPGDLVSLHDGAHLWRYSYYTETDMLPPHLRAQGQPSGSLLEVYHHKEFLAGSGMWFYASPGSGRVQVSYASGSMSDQSLLPYYQRLMQLSSADAGTSRVG